MTSTIKDQQPLLKADELGRGRTPPARRESSWSLSGKDWSRPSRVVHWNHAKLGPVGWNGSLAGMMNQHDSQLAPALKFTQIREQRGDLGGIIFIDPMQE